MRFLDSNILSVFGKLSYLLHINSCLLLSFRIVSALEQGVAWVDNETFVTGSANKGLIDSFVVAVTYNLQTSSIYFVLLSSEIKQTDANLTKITRSF